MVLDCAPNEGTVQYPADSRQATTTGVAAVLFIQSPTGSIATFVARIQNQRVDRSNNTRMQACSQLQRNPRGISGPLPVCSVLVSPEVSSLILPHYSACAKRLYIN